MARDPVEACAVLSRLGIPLRVREPAATGRGYHYLEGVLGPFVIEPDRYWRIRGPVPVAVAWEMYASELGRKVVRIDGHCGCPPPERPWLTWRTRDGRQVSTLKDRAQCEQFIPKLWPSMAELERRFLFHDDPASIGAAAYVEAYQVDTDEGLALFVETVRRHKLDTIAAWAPGGAP